MSEKKFEYRSFDISKRVVDDDQRLIDYCASTTGIDRYKTRVLDWNEDGIARYLGQNPVVLWAHNSHMPPIARTLAIKHEPGRMLTRIQFAPKEVYEFADTIYKLNREGFLSGLSVGFMPGKREFNEELKCLDLMDNVLFEQSCVPIPGNGDAGRLENALRDMSIPEPHQHLLVANYAMKAEGIEGINDMSALQKDVLGWAETEQFGRSIQVDVPIEFEEPEGDEPGLGAKAPAPVVSQRALERIEELTEEVRLGQTLAEELTQDLKVQTDENVAMRAWVRIIAATVDFDFTKLDADGSLLSLASAVQAATVRIGATLSRQNMERLGAAIDALVSIRESAVKGQDIDADDNDEPRKAPDSKSDVSPDAKRLDDIERALLMIGDRLDDKTRVTSARQLIESGEEDRHDSVMDSILDRLGGGK